MARYRHKVSSCKVKSYLEQHTRRGCLGTERLGMDTHFQED